MWRLIIQIIVKSAAVGIAVTSVLQYVLCDFFLLIFYDWSFPWVRQRLSETKMASLLAFGWALKNSSSFHYVWLAHSFHSYYSFTPLPSVSMATGIAPYRISRDSVLLLLSVKDYPLFWNQIHCIIVQFCSYSSRSRSQARGSCVSISLDFTLPLEAGGRWGFFWI